MVSLWKAGGLPGVKPASATLRAQMTSEIWRDALHAVCAEHGRQIVPTLSTQLGEQLHRTASLTQARAAVGHLPHAQDTSEDQT